LNKKRILKSAWNY